MYALLRHRVGRHALLFPPQTQNRTQRLPRRPWVLSNPLPLTLTLTLTLALTLALTLTLTLTLKLTLTRLSVQPSHPVRRGH